jgi:site-specific DNA-methyltransferase (adenine-specific)
MEYDVIIHGDSIEEMKRIASESIDLIFADPPYWMRTTGVLNRVEGTDFNGVYEDWDKFQSNEDYSEFTRKWLTECKRILKKNGSLWVIGGMQCIYTVGGIMQDLGFWLINDVIWQKSNPTPNFMGTRLNNSHETLIWATKSEKSKYTFNYKTAKELNVDTVSSAEYDKGVRKQLGSVWKFPVASGNERVKDDDGHKLHSTQKPESLLYRIIAISSTVDDLVLDPFGGTMTTGVVAKQMGRQYIMIERDSKYCSYGQKRLDRTIPLVSDIETAIFDVKPKRAKMKDMISQDYFKVGEKFYLKNNDNYATLEQDGKLLIHGKIVDMHTGAAILGNLKSDRVNGFDYWLVERDGKMVSISDVREKYRKHLEKNS